MGSARRRHRAEPRWELHIEDSLLVKCQQPAFVSSDARLSGEDRARSITSKRDAGNLSLSVEIIAGQSLPPRLVAADLDGTLLLSDTHRLSPATIRSVGTLRRMGI